MGINHPESDKARGNWGMMASRLGDSSLEVNGDAIMARTAYELGRKCQQEVFSDPKSEEYDEVTNKATARGPDQRAVAEKQYAEVLKIRKELVAIDPDNLIWRAAYILALAHAGQVEDAAKQVDGFQKKAAKSPALMLQIARTYAVCADAATDPAQKKRHVATALGALRTATAGDYEDAVALRTDPDFDSLKTEPGFSALVGEVAQRGGKR